MYKFFDDLSTLGDFDVLFNDINLDVQPITVQLGNLVSQSGPSGGFGIVTTFHQGIDFHDIPAPDFDTLVGSDGYAIPSSIQRLQAQTCPLR